MKETSKFASAVLAGVLALSMTALAQPTSYDGAIQQSVAAQLQKKSSFRNVRSSVSQGIVTLSGTVDSYKAKLDAQNKAQKQKHVAGVRNVIEVSGPAISDVQLRNELAKSLRYDRVGFGNVFNVLTVGVKNGVVTVGGEVRTPADKDSALATIAATKGVKDVVDRVKVAPASFYDDGLRLRLARAIYRDPVLSKYALDPQAPIRILVDNGHVALYGSVDSTLDRTVAGMRADQVFGAFSVENHLTTAQDVAR